MDEITEHSLKSSTCTNKISHFSRSTEPTLDFNKSSFTSSGRSSSYNSSISTFDIVRDTVQDVVTLQSNELQHVRDLVHKQKANYITKEKYEKTLRELEAEKLSHEKTKIQLEKESHRAKFAEGEVAAFKNSLNQEHSKHEEDMKYLRTKASRETQRSDYLQNKCYELEMELQRKSEELHQREEEIEVLKRQLVNARRKHKKHVEDEQLDKMQTQYMSKSLSDRNKRRAPP